MIGFTFALLLQATATTTAPPPQLPPATITPAVPARQQEYVIGAADVLDVIVFGEEDASRPNATVDNDGSIDMPYIGRVTVGGKTSRAVEDEVKARLIKGKYLVNPSVSVTIKQYRSKSVSVQGYVRNQGEYILQGNVSLSSALAQAGSMTPDAGSYVIISRRNPQGGTEQIRVSRRDIESGRAQDVLLKDGDTVLVPKAETFFITGYVRSPGSYAWEDGLTLERALTFAGGPTERAAVGRVEIERTVNGKTVKLKAKLNDPVLANDTIRVPQRIF
jgi:protein involved in polysaccharide export with SLBB domain